MTAAASPIDAGTALRQAFYTMAVAAFADAKHVLVDYTLATELAEDIVVIGPVSGGRKGELGSMGQRTQDWTYELEVSTYAVRFNGDESAADRDAYAAAAGLLATLGERLRRVPPNGDVTLGGVALMCQLEKFEATPGREAGEQGVARMWSFDALFTALVRTTG